MCVTSPPLSPHPRSCHHRRAYLPPAAPSTLCPYTTLFRSVLPRTPGNNVYVGFMVWSNFTATKCRGLVRPNHEDRKSGSAGMPRPISYAVFCLKKKILVEVMIELYLLGTQIVQSEHRINLK